MSIALPVTDPKRRGEAWARFDAVAAQDGESRIETLFEQDAGRVERLTLEVAGLTLDLSKQAFSARGLDAGLALAEACDVGDWKRALFNGAAVNATEGRAVLHPALRAPDGAHFEALGEPVSREVEQVRDQMVAYAEAIRVGDEVGATGQPFRAVVHIGIGGSDLGPRLVWDALRPLDPAIDVRFVANIDPREMAEALTGLDPASTLVIVVSKTFTTQETLANARLARDWLAAALPEDGLRRHLVGVSAAPDKAEAFGCGQVFGFSDWVGGRYSLWSAVSLSCVIGLGGEAFRHLLAGASAMDRHFLETPLSHNAPVLLALAQVYNVEGLKRRARTVAPYAHGLRRLPAFLQQLEMESNGKRVTRDGSPAVRGTGPVVFGEPGTNGQHAFFQQLHQGPEVVPAEFVVVRETMEGRDGAPLWSNAVAQSEALMRGRTAGAALAGMVDQGMDQAEAERLAPHRTFPGNRPSTTILIDRLTPQALGALLALYEHKTFVEGVIWDINSFDQWGVELGKVMATRILGAAHEKRAPETWDPSTRSLFGRMA
ncbi:glucose-6-phosphate isomerase [Brevundimonas sp.]|uniref:glucose-6-phosphate isomerase n=1 Tax=Brevundimonas sp. TaxID=1871086 RepID=UPI003AF94983